MVFHPRIFFSDRRLARLVVTRQVPPMTLRALVDVEQSSVPVCLDGTHGVRPGADFIRVAALVG